MSFQSFEDQVVAKQRNQEISCRQQELEYHQDAVPQIALLILIFCLTAPGTFPFASREAIPDTV